MATNTGTAAARAGKHLTFCLGREVFGVEILKVQEIIGLMPITAVPRVPAFVRGVINLRGKVIPVVDLPRKFDMPPRDDTEKTCIIVLQVGNATGQTTMGVIVDEVAEVLNIQPNQIEPPPSFGTAVDTAFIVGMGKVGEKVIMLLDVDRILSCSEADAVARIETTATAGPA